MTEIALIVVLAAGYLRGLRIVWSTPVGRTLVRPWRAAAFVVGCLVAAGVVSPPFERLAHELFSAHMAQHVVLILLVAPLLAAGAAQVVLVRVVPRRLHDVGVAIRRRGVRPGGTGQLPVLLVLGTALHLLALWVWHAPPMYEAALRAAVVHVAEHASLLGTSLLVWTALLRPGRRARRDSGAGVLCTWLLAAQGGVLAALIVFASQPLYPTYAEAGRAAVDVDVLADQQLAGVLMWIPGGVVYGTAGVLVFVRWFSGMQVRSDAGGDATARTIVRAPDAGSTEVLR